MVVTTSVAAETAADSKTAALKERRGGEAVSAPGEGEGRDGEE